MVEISRQNVIPQRRDRDQVIRVDISLDDDCTWAINSPKEVSRRTLLASQHYVYNDDELQNVLPFLWKWCLLLLLIF